MAGHIYKLIEKRNETFRIDSGSHACTVGGRSACRASAVTNIRVRLASNGEILAEGPLGWGITPFEGNLYIRKKHMRTDKFRVNYVPGLCPYKFLYVWMNLHLNDGAKIRNLAWMYWLPNPLLPFIWFRVALPRAHPDLEIEEY